MKVVQTICAVAVGIAISVTCNSASYAQGRVQARLIWQDTSTQSLWWGDLKKGSKWSIKKETVEKQPKLDADRQMFVQMQPHGDIALVGVRDDDDGNFNSGWFAIHSGVTKDSHGDHFHWHYSAAPSVKVSKLDKKQGNPAHVYLYEGGFYIANDKKNGFTHVAPKMLGNAKQADRFYKAGGGHITLAAVNGKVAYSTWIDRAGENEGRVDVVGLGSEGKGYHFHLPSGGIHGATTNSGKVFFAPADGICWVSADTQLKQTEDSVDVFHISLGENSEGTPKRTGAFVNQGSHVLFTVGGNELCMLDAASAKPSVQSLDIEVKEGSRLTTPKLIQSRTGGKFAMLFEESPSGDNEELLHIVSLDPNRDGKFDDAMIKKTIKTGKSLIEGHSGHHEAVALSKKYVAVTNPGDGTLSIISTSSWEVEATLDVEGTPTRLVSFGGVE